VINGRVGAERSSAFCGNADRAIPLESQNYVLGQPANFEQPGRFGRGRLGQFAHGSDHTAIAHPTGGKTQRGRFCRPVHGSPCLQASVRRHGRQAKNCTQFSMDQSALQRLRDYLDPSSRFAFAGKS
jgi:hypothetical protein